MSVTIEIAEEVAYGSPDANGDPDGSTLSWLSFRANRADIAPAGDAPANASEFTRDGLHDLPPEPDTAETGGTVKARRTGDVALNVPMEYPGSTSTQFTGPEDVALFKALASGMADGGAPGAASDVVAADVDVNNFEPTTVANYSAGDLLAVLRNNKVEGFAVTEVTAGGTPNIKYNVATSTKLEAAEVVRFCRQLYMPGGADTGLLGNSVAFRRNARNWRETVFGCRWTQANMTLVGGRVMWALTFPAAHFEDEHSSWAVVDPVRPPGGDAHARKTFVLLSDAAAPTSGTTPAELGRLKLDCDEISISLTNEYEPQGITDALIDASDMDIVGRSVEVSLTLSAEQTALDTDFFEQRHRSFLMTLGPLAEGRGAVIYAPSLFLSNWSGGGRDRSNRRTRQKLTFRAGRGAGDGGSADYGTASAANAMFRIGWVDRT